MTRCYTISFVIFVFSLLSGYASTYRDIKLKYKPLTEEQLKNSYKPEVNKNEGNGGIVLLPFSDTRSDCDSMTIMLESDSKNEKIATKYSITQWIQEALAMELTKRAVPVFSKSDEGYSLFELSGTVNRLGIVKQEKNWDFYVELEISCKRGETVLSREIYSGTYKTRSGIVYAGFMKNCLNKALHDGIKDASDDVVKKIIYVQTQVKDSITLARKIWCFGNRKILI